MDRRLRVSPQSYVIMSTRKRLATVKTFEHDPRTTMLVILILLVDIVSATTPATPDIECRGHSRKYKTHDRDGNPVCVPCSPCSPGYGVLRPCTEYQDTVCEACEPGKTFSGTESPWRRCESCVQCAAHELRRRECTPTRNGRCSSCETGWFHNDITGDCDVCSWCYPEYPAITDFVSGCNVTGVPPGFHCAPILDAPYPPPLRDFHGTTETSHRTEPLEHHHLIEYVGEEDHSLGDDRERDMSTHCTPTKTSPFSEDVPTEYLTDSVRIFTEEASNRRLSSQSGQDLQNTRPVRLSPGAVVGIAVAMVVTCSILIAVLFIKGRARDYLREGNEGLYQSVELKLSERPTDKTPLVENHGEVAFQDTVSTII
ncbi:PREDICTED: tumor necrosis factor receptor superfamily member 6B-like [Branchiostoma belcheri]|uniref:Tumor necrosis factor receptor superfamily member 6B-like n=1 Tax=Branchiostoma belcheri TaxID=7741 RepID=A0A6P5AMX5_BRABE|nr:PREDICTED: tumor necrosis factor receptor superfamily member 6B-like [Branchiostoma belcheri]